MFLEQPRPHFLPNSRPTATNLARKDTRLSVSKTLCALRYIIKYIINEQIKTAIKKNLKHVPLKINNLKKVKTCFHICLEEKRMKLLVYTYIVANYWDVL